MNTIVEKSVFLTQDTGASIQARLVSSNIITRSWYDIYIFDCERRIRLHGNIYTDEDKLTALKKIDTLIETLSIVRVGVLACEVKKTKLKVKKKKVIVTKPFPVIEP